jgi:outer membrane receptor for ferrienterochelin and colicin
MRLYPLTYLLPRSKAKALSVLIKLFVPLHLLVPVTQIKAQQDSSHIFNLDLEDLARLKVYSAAKVEQPVGEIPSGVSILTKTEIREKGYTTLEAALSDVPGFQFRNIQGMNSYVFQRGIPNQNNLTLVLIDGIQVNELNSGGFYSGGQYNLNNVERIEIIYGPSSVEYGTNAVSGIINIITKSALKTEVNSNMSYGSFNSGHADFTISGSNSTRKKGIRLSGMYRSTDKTPLGGASGDYNWSTDMENFERNLAIDVKAEAPHWTIGTNFQHKQASRTTLEKTVGTRYRDKGTFWNILFLNNYVKYKRSFSENTSLWAMVYHRNTTALSNSIYSVTDTAQIGSYRPGNLSGAEVVAEFLKTKKMRILGGSLFEYTRFSEAFSFTRSSSEFEAPPAPPAPPLAEQYLASIFVEPRISIIKNLTLVAAGRYDYSSAVKHVFTPRTGLTYSLDKQTFRASWAEGYRIPRPWDITYGIGNNNLKSEHMKTIEIGTARQITTAASVEVRAYKNRFDNLLTIQNSTAGSRWINRGEVTTDGLECIAQYRIQIMRLYLAYTFTDSYDGGGSRLKEISQHTAQGSVTFIVKKYLHLNFRAQFVGGRENPKIIPATGDFKIQPYLIFHGAITLMRYRGFTLQTMVENITDEKYFHPSHRSPDRFPQSQRSITFTLGYQISRGS